MQSMGPPQEVGKSPEPIRSCRRIRVFIAKTFKGEEFKRIDYHTLNRLVVEEGLPHHMDPFGSGRWVFVESEVTAWFQARMAGNVKPMRGPGRPLKSAS